MTETRDLDLSRAVRAKMRDLAREQGLSWRDACERFRAACESELEDMRQDHLYEYALRREGAEA